MDNLTVGRIVHVGTKDEKRCQAAIVVRVWSPTSINAVAFRDGSNDRGVDDVGEVGASDLLRWATSLTEGGGGLYGFHDPRACPLA